MAQKTWSQFLFRMAGGCIVLIWIVMIALLVKKTHFNKHAAEAVPPAFKAESNLEAREWKEIYLKDRKVGYAVSLIASSDQGYYLQEELFLKLNLMGLGRSLYAATQAQVDRALLLRSFRMTMRSGVVRFAVAGKMKNKVLVVTTESAGTRRMQKIPLETTPVLSAGLSHFFKTRRLEVGESHRIPLFDPSSLSQQTMVITVSAKEPLTLNHTTYEAYRLEGELWGKRLTVWVDDAGRCLKEEGFMGFTAVRSSAARAPRGIQVENSDDLYEMVAIKPDRLLPHPERVTFLKLKVQGIEENHPHLNRTRQSMKGNLLEITKERLPSEGYSLLPFRDLPDDMKRYMTPDLTMESDDPRIIEWAQRISEGSNDPADVARKCLDWVYRQVEKKPVLAVPSALEVLRTREGDCNEHATLLTALLRAAGIPARLCIGLAYTRDKFYYHAWTEAWLGSWVSLDATLNQMPADATHITWAEGNLTQQMEVARIVGEMNIQVIDFRYD